MHFSFKSGVLHVLSDVTSCYLVQQISGVGMSSFVNITHSPLVSHLPYSPNLTFPLSKPKRVQQKKVSETVESVMRQSKVVPKLGAF